MFATEGDAASERIKLSHELSSNGKEKFQAMYNAGNERASEFFFSAQCLRVSLETQVKRNFLTMSQPVKHYTRFSFPFFFQAATLYINTIRGIAVRRCVLYSPRG